MLNHQPLLAKTFLLAALLSGAAMPAYAATPKTAAPAMQAAKSTEAMQDKAEKKPAKELSPEERIERRIQELRTKLQITEAQAELWKPVEDTMRDNEKTIRELIAARHEKGETRTALEDLTSYQKISAAHAEGLEKFISAFQPLYEAMPDEQKKNADTAFARFEGYRGRHAHNRAQQQGAETSK